MERQPTTTEVKYMDDYSKALIDAAVDNIHSNYTWAPVMREESIPSPKENPHYKEQGEGGSKDPKASAAPGDTKRPSGQKQFGAEIRDTTKVVTAESVEVGEGVIEAFEVEIDGETYIFEKKNAEGKEQGLDGKACWKGYKRMGTKKKGGKTVDNCVKAGFEPEGEMLEGKCSHCNGKGCEKCGKDGKLHNCATKVKKEGVNFLVVPGQHTLLEDGTVTHYDLLGEGGVLLKNVPVEELEVVEEGMHEHVVNHAKNAEVLGEKKLDPVGKEDKDIDNDGDHDKSDKYLLSRRKKVGKIIAAKKKVKEETEITEKK